MSVLVLVIHFPTGIRTVVQSCVLSTEQSMLSQQISFTTAVSLSGDVIQCIDVPRVVMTVSVTTGGQDDASVLVAFRRLSEGGRVENIPELGDLY